MKKKKSTKIKEKPIPHASADDEYDQDEVAPLIEAGIGGGGAVVYWETGTEEGGRCCATLEATGLDRDVLFLLLDESAPPKIYSQAPPGAWNLLGDKRLRVDFDTRPSRAEFEEVHDRLLAVLELMLEPTKEQGIALLAHKKRAVRDYALLWIRKWRKRWKSETPQPKGRRSERVYVER